MGHLPESVLDLGMGVSRGLSGSFHFLQTVGQPPLKAFAGSRHCHLRCGPMKKLALFVSLFLVAAGPRVFAQANASTDPLAPTRDTKSAVEIDREWQQSVAKYDGERKRLLAEADKQANDGPYRPDWGSLMKYQQPQWYKDAKFGIFIHWGVYSVPAAESEWYPRNMYRPGEGAYKNFREHFASNDPSKGYKDFIPLFRAEHF